MTKQKTIGQVKLALNGRDVQRLIRELKRQGHEYAFEVFMNGVFYPLLEQVYERGQGKDVIIKIEKEKLKW